MNTRTLEVPGVLLLEPRVFRDERGFFLESFNANAFAEATGLDVAFVQDNHSRSTRGVLRGLHYQMEPRAQGKLLRVVQGEIFDVAVDLREGSATFGRWVGTRLSAENHHQLWVPPGFAHGFLVLSEVADVLYKTTDLYAPSHERAIRWNDPSIGISWPSLPGGVPPTLSDRDRIAPSLADAVAAGDLFP
jgi:dTDP-4-dehydrorhamnose 3,5-epimerase